jgi:hypothetical protein
MSKLGAEGSANGCLRAPLLGGMLGDGSTTLSTLVSFVWVEDLVAFELSVSLRNGLFLCVDTGGGAASSKLLAIELVVSMRARGWVLCLKDEGVALSILSLKVVGKACESFRNCSFGDIVSGGVGKSS